MNPAEEALSDACAFAIARGLSLAKAGPARPYDYMIRGLKFGPRAMIGGERKEQEFDILGVRIDPFEVDCFEAKMGCSGSNEQSARNQRRKLRHQLGQRRALGLFTHVYGCFDHDGPVQTQKHATGCGTIWTRGSGQQLQVVVGQPAGRLDVPHNREWERFREKVFAFRDALDATQKRIGPQPLVFLRCPACGPYQQFFYGHHLHVPQEYGVEGRSPHAPFCPSNPERAASVAFRFNETHKMVEDEWRQTDAAAEYLGVVRLR